MKIYLGIDPSDTTYDVFLTSQITLVSQTIEAYCNRKFEATDYIQTFYREDQIVSDRVLDEVTCFQFPIITVASVISKENDADAGDPVTDYRIHKPTAKVIKNRYSGWLRTGCSNILEVTYRAGFEVIPAPVLEVVYSVVQERYNKKKSGIDLNFGSDVQSIAIPGVINIQYDFSLQNNQRDSAFGSILGSNANVLDYFRSERAVIGDIRLAYNEED